jgi:hypothetical protein
MAVLFLFLILLFVVHSCSLFRDCLFVLSHIFFYNFVEYRCRYLN